MGRFWDLLMYTVLAAMVVAVIMNAKAVSGLLGTGLNGWIKETTVLTGSGYKNAK